MNSDSSPLQETKVTTGKTDDTGQLPTVAGECENEQMRKVEVKHRRIWAAPHLVLKGHSHS